MDYLNKYQTNDICNFCNKFNKSCDGKMWLLNKASQNNYCPNFEDRKYANEPIEYHLKKFSEYTSKNN